MKPESSPRLVCTSEPTRCALCSSQQPSRGMSGISSQLDVNGSHLTSQKHFEDDLALKKGWFPQLRWGREDCGNGNVRTGDSWAEGPWARRLRFHTIPKMCFSGPTGRRHLGAESPSLQSSVTHSPRNAAITLFCLCYDLLSLSITWTHMEIIHPKHRNVVKF